MAVSLVYNEVKIGQRRKARRVALQALFEIDYTRHNPEAAVRWLAGESNLSEEATSFVRELVLGTIKDRENLDVIIQKFAPAWPIEQIASVDRNILRLGIYEIWSRKVPAKVAINEAVELAKSFGSESSPKFVNGVLGSAYAQIIEEGA
jgi:N utilization substance protein B